MSSKHTPGPWTLSAYYPNRVIGDRNDGEGRYVADCHCNGLNGAEQPEDAANARLIAAAPDLLEALKTLVTFAETSDECQYGTIGTKFLREIALPALAKATGSAS
jgi:hypothetical protein